MAVLAPDFEFEYAVVDLEDDITQVTGKQAVLRAITVRETFSAHTANVVDGEGTTLIETLPASTTAGTRFEYYDLPMKGGIIIDPDNAASAGQLVVIFKPRTPS